MKTLFDLEGFPWKSIDAGIISSVVPSLNDTFVRMIEKVTGKVPLVLGPAVYGRLPVRVPESAVHEIGTDLVCDAVAAYTTYKKACIVIDFGTALTFTAVDASGEIRGVAAIVGCNNPKSKADSYANILAKELIKRNVLVLKTGCAAIAASLGIDQQAFKACMVDPRTQQKIESDQAEFKAAHQVIAESDADDQIGLVEGISVPHEDRESHAAVSEGVPVSRVSWLCRAKEQKGN